MSHNADGFVLIKDRVPRTGKGVDNLLSQLAQYLRLPENKYVQKMVIDSQRIYLYFEKMVPKSQAPEEASMTWHNAVRRVPMEEIDVEEAKEQLTPHLHRYVFDLFERVTKNGYEVCQILIGSNSQLYQWVSLPRRSERFFGVPLTKDGDIPDDIIIVCGGTSRECDPEEVAYSVKGMIP